MSLKWNDAIKKAWKMFEEKDKYAYFYGAKGQVLTDAVMDRLWEQNASYFKKYTAKQKKDIYNYSRGKIGLDCSGFVCWVFEIPQMYSTGLYEQCPIKTTVANGVHGSIVYTTFGGTGRHIGIDVGYGNILHMGKEGSSVEYMKNASHPGFWEKSGELKGVDYTQANDYHGRLNV